MNTSRFKKFIAVILLGGLLLTGCTHDEIPAESSPALIGAEDLAPVESHSATPDHFSLPYAPGQSLDPIVCPDGMQQVAASLMYEGLFRLTPDFEAEHWLCKEYTYDSETLTYVFTLRDGVVFSDGAAFTGSDVKASLLRAQTSDRYASRLACIQSVSADETTVTVTLNTPHTALPALLDIPIVKAGSEQDAVPIGTGPYLFSAETSGAWLIANQTWWAGDLQPTERITLVEAADQDTKLYRFTTHDVQLITTDLTGTDPIHATGNISYQDADTTILQFLGCNTTLAPMNSSEFRRVLSSGINRYHIADAFLSGHGSATQFPVSPVSQLYPADLESAYTPDGFAAAVAALQYTPERTLTLLVNGENQFKVSIAQYLAESYTAAGIPMETRVLPWEEYTAALAAGEFDLYYGEVKLSADWDVSDLLASGAPLNFGGWNNVQTDRLLADCLSASDRDAAIQTLCAHLQKTAPILPLCFKSTSVLMQSNILKGLTPTMTHPFYNLPDCTIQLQTP